MSATDQLGQAWKADFGRLFDQISVLTGAQQQIAAAMPQFDLSALLPRFDVATFLDDTTMRALSQSAVTTRVFDQLPAFSGLQQQVAAAMPRFDLSGVLATLNSTFLTNESLAQVYTAALRMAASLPLDVRDDVRPLLPDGNTEEGLRSGGTEEQVLLLLLAVVGWIAAVHLEAADSLVKVVSSLMESGVVLADLIGQAYNALSQNAPDDKLLSWALLLAAVLKSVRKTEG